MRNTWRFVILVYCRLCCNVSIKSKTKERNNKIKNKSWRWSHQRKHCPSGPLDPAEPPLPTGASAPWVHQDGSVMEQTTLGPLGLSDHPPGVGWGTCRLPWSSSITGQVSHLYYFQNGSPTHIKTKQKETFCRIQKMFVRIGAYCQAPI